jgi:hypothetical protein
MGRGLATCQGKKEDPTGGVHLLAGGRERAGYPFGVRGVTGPGRNGGWARKVPRGPFLFLTSFSIFLFCFILYLSYLLQNNASNQFKQFPKIF